MRVSDRHVVIIATLCQYSHRGDQGLKELVKTTSDKEFREVRLEKFHETLRQLARTKLSFNKSVEVDVGHIVRRGSESDAFRWALSNEIIAAIVLKGKLNLGKCNGVSPLELAIEGKLLNFKWIDAKAVCERTEAVACIRVVIRERKPKHYVVTAYRDLEGKIDPNDTPEVDHEVW